MCIYNSTIKSPSILEAHALSSPDAYHLVLGAISTNLGGFQTFLLALHEVLRASERARKE
jgi:hypothetical protein